MIVQHKKTKQEHYITVEDWNKIIERGWQGAYKVIDNTEFVAKSIDINPKDITKFEVQEIKLEKPKRKTKTKKTDNGETGKDPD